MKPRSFGSEHLLEHDLFVVDERGATAVEYGMLVALVAAVVIGTIVLLGPLVNGLYQEVTWW